MKVFDSVKKGLNEAIEIEKKGGKKMKVCFTGRRPKYLGTYNLKDEIWQKIRTATKEKIISLISQGATDFYTGGALGFDLLAAEILDELKEEGFEFNHVFCQATENQANRWRQEDKDKFERIKQNADQVINVWELKDYKKVFYASQLNARNDYMVDNADLVLALWEGTKTGGTWNCIKYAFSKKRKVEWLNYKQGEK